MRRALAILKYLPAVMCGLLIVVWAVSFFFGFSFVFRVGNDPAAVELNVGNLVVWRGSTTDARGFRVGRLREVNHVSYSGRFDYQRSVNDHFMVFLPIPALLTLLLPFAIGSFVRFRFPLWSYFAFTALVAVELAYYLR